MPDRKASLSRKTGETKVAVTVNLDGTGKYTVASTSGFLDHMVSQLARHGLFDITVKAERDASGVHHVAEDVGIMLGRVFHQAIGDGKGIRRMGDARVPLDEALATVAVDFSGRGGAYLDMKWVGEFAEDLPVEVISHVLESFAREGHFTLHIVVSGQNNHHIAESTFKALAKALRMASEIDPRGAGVPSTKGTINS